MRGFGSLAEKIKDIIGPIFAGILKALPGGETIMKGLGDAWKGVTGFFTGNRQNNQTGGGIPTSTLKPASGTALKGTYDSFLGGRPAFTSGFGLRNTGIPGASTDHKGIDIGVDPGAEVKAIQDGVVEDIYPSFGNWGDGVVVKHADGSKNVYGHVKSEVKIGDEVKAGQRIATIEYWPDPKYPAGRQHLHLERIEGGTKVDPQTYLDELKASDDAKVKADLNKIEREDGQNEPIPVPENGAQGITSNYGLKDNQKFFFTHTDGMRYEAYKTKNGFDIYKHGGNIIPQKIDTSGGKNAAVVRSLIQAGEQCLQPKGNAATLNQESAAVQSNDRAAAATKPVVVPVTGDKGKTGSTSVPAAPQAAAGTDGQGLQALATASSMSKV